MAWTSTEEEAMDIIGKHMQSMRLEKKRELNELYSRLIFPKTRSKLDGCQVDYPLGSYFCDNVG